MKLYTLKKLMFVTKLSRATILRHVKEFGEPTHGKKGRAFLYSEKTLQNLKDFRTPQGVKSVELSERIDDLEKRVRVLENG